MALTSDIAQRISEGVREQGGWLRDLRRDLHRHPELRFEEVRTAERLTEELRANGLEVRTGLARGTGLTAVLEGEAPEGALDCVALRADLDALPIQEETGLPFASTRPGVMHACGHDAHAAVVATLARVMARDRDLRRALPGKLVFLFQPAEEGGFGAREMIASRALEEPEVEAILGLHVHPVLRTGELSVYRGASHASADAFVVRFSGKGGHAGYPHLSRDPVTPLAETLLGMRSLVTREVDPLSPAVLSVGMIRGGNADNVVAESTEIHGTLRCVDEDVRAYLKRRLGEMAEGFAGAHRAEATITWDEGCPATINDPRLGSLLKQEASAVVPSEGVHELPPGMGAEDFGVYTQAIPGALFRLGCTPPSAMEWFPLHSPRFNLDEASLELGAQILLRSAFRLLGEGLEAAA
jgi:amidohydrolase